MEFEAFPKIPRLRRECVITEKIDGTNAQVAVTPEGLVLAGSRTRYVTPENDNAGFARWVKEHEDELRTGLGVGRHYGEWWGSGINRRYGLSEKRFSLFNTDRWTPETLPSCCSAVPVLYKGVYSDVAVDEALESLLALGSAAAKGFMNPEGVVVFMRASGTMHKVLLVGDELPKGITTLMERRVAAERGQE